MADTVFVTGAAGFVGRHLVAALLAAEPELELVVLRSPGRSADFRSPRVRTLEARLEALPFVLPKHTPRDGFAGVFHLAAYIPKSAGAEDVHSALESNIRGTEQLLLALGDRAASLVFLSTVDVYGAPEGPLDEASALRPVSVYAGTKLLGELLVRDWSQRTGRRAVSLRLGHTYGPGEEAFRKLIPTTIRTLLAGQPAAQFGSGEELRDLLYVGDAAALLHRAWRALQTSDLPTLNLVTGRSHSVAQVLALLRALTGSPHPIEQRALTGTPRSFRFDARALHTHLPLARYTDLEDGLRAEVEWFRALEPAP